MLLPHNNCITSIKFAGKLEIVIWISCRSLLNDSNKEQYNIWPTCFHLYHVFHELLSNFSPTDYFWKFFNSIHSYIFILYKLFFWHYRQLRRWLQLNYFCTISKSFYQVVNTMNFIYECLARLHPLVYCHN